MTAPQLAATPTVTVAIRNLLFAAAQAGVPPAEAVRLLAALFAGAAASEGVTE